jgi:hypothetical protein
LVVCAFVRFVHVADGVHIFLLPLSVAL